MGLMAWIGQGLFGFAKLVAFPFAKLGCPRVRPFVRWTLHALCVLTILGCLGWLNAALQFDRAVRAPAAWLRESWLPLLFLFVYALAWLAWWLWRVATSPAQRSPFPELEDAWQEAVRALDQARIDLLRTPVYLLIGGAPERLPGFVQATGMKWDVPLTPRRLGASLRIFANRDAIFIDLSRASASGLYASRLAEQPAAVQETTSAVGGDLAENAWADDRRGSVATAEATGTRRVAHRGLELIEQSLALLETEQAGTAHVTSSIDGVHVSEEECVAAQERVAYVCGLLTDARAPYCPANGVLTLIAWEATATSSTSNRAAVLLDRDLQTIGEELRVAAPCLAVVTDLETAVGGRDLLARIPPDQRQRRFGVRFPHLHPADTAQQPQLIAEGIAWLTREMLPAMIYRVLQGGAADTNADTWLRNARIFAFLNALHERESRFVRILERGLLPTRRGTPVGGLYFAANASDNPGGQAFLAGVMPQVLEMQNDVAWTTEAVADDARARRWTALGYLTLAALITGALLAALSV